MFDNYVDMLSDSNALFKTSIALSRPLTIYIRLHKYAGWSGSTLVANALRFDIEEHRAQVFMPAWVRFCSRVFVINQLN